MALWVLTLVGLGLVWLASSALRLHTNYRNARRSGFPLLVCPINPENVLFIIAHVPFVPLLRRLLPTAAYTRLAPALYGWEFRDKHALHDALGPVFVYVTTGRNQLWVADPALAQIVLARRKDFGILPVVETVMGLQGPNMISTTGETWARQRRLIAPNLNERISALVWAESRAQAAHMAAYVLQPGPPPDTVNALRAVAINVLGRVGYGRARVFRPLSLPRSPAAPMDYVDAIALVTELVAVAAVVPAAVLALPWMPAQLRTLGAAKRRLPRLTARMLDHERCRDKTSDHAGGNIMSMLVRLADDAQTHARKPCTPSSSDHYLAEDEVAGNLFLVTGAGFDTTANTLAYALLLAAAYPDVQAWLQQELDRVLGPPPGRLDPDALPALDYAALYPRLVRCLAFMFEILRLFPPVVHLTRASHTDQAVVLHGTSHALVGPYAVFINTVALHTRPALWGADPDDFRPQRWVVATSATDPEPAKSAGSAESAESPETLVMPARGTFLPWSGGPRVCPGQKMSQVEFVVTVATLLWTCRVAPVLCDADGETPAQAAARLRALAEDSQPRMTLQMNRPDDVRLRWTIR